MKPIKAGLSLTRARTKPAVQQGKIPPAGHARPICAQEHALEVQPVALRVHSGFFPFHSIPGVAAAGWDVGLGCSDTQGCAVGCSGPNSQPQQLDGGEETQVIVAADETEGSFCI